MAFVYFVKYRRMFILPRKGIPVIRSLFTLVKLRLTMQNICPNLTLMLLMADLVNTK